MRISDWSSDVCSSDLTVVQERAGLVDSTESARTYLNALLDEPDQVKLEAFLAESPELVTKLEEDPLLEFQFQAFPDYFERPGRVPGGRSFVPTPLPLEQIGERLDLVRPPVDRERVGKSHHLRSEEHTSELQSLMRTSSAVF